ncbi:MAG: GNAT family N-acetyltransferase [Phycisphaerae bacterium]|nr:GNAT family N-acetyltransferase [Phycisphaerae bacterium]MDW8262309.1 GNAT family N-acetyltransferase [Phycisphaerales bacterium]
MHAIEPHLHGAIRWLDPGRLVDRELELVAPSERWIEEVLAACRHPLTVRQAPREAGTTRRQLMDFLRAAPGGHDPGDPALQRAPGYAFWMRLLPEYSPPVAIAGGCSLRISEAPEVQRYFGNVGYHVFPPARGRRLAERACRLLLPLARAHGLRQLWITCNPDNWASRKTCERLGARLIDIVALPPQNILYQRGEREKCRYLLEL